VFNTKYNPPGLDWGDVLGFGAEMVTDPLTYLGGLGTGTKSGKVAAKIAEESGRLKAATKMGVRPAIAASSRDRLVKLVREAAEKGYPERLERGWGAQAAAKQRSLIKFQVPFTNIEKDLIYAPKVLEKIEALGPLLKKLPGAETVGRTFSTKFGRAAAMEPYRESYDVLRRTGQQRVGDINEELTGLYNQVKKTWTGPEEDLQRKIIEGVEYTGIPEKAAVQKSQIAKDLEERIAEHRRVAEERWLADRAKVAEAIRARGLDEAGKASYAAGALRGSKIDPKVANMLEAQARGILDAGKGESGRLAREGTERATSQVWALLNRADDLEAAGRSEDALQLFEKAYRIDRNTRTKKLQAVLKKADKLVNAPEEAARLRQEAQDIFSETEAVWQQRAATAGERARAKAYPIQQAADAMRQEGFAAKEANRYEDLYGRLLASYGNRAAKAQARPMNKKALERLEAAIQRSQKRATRKTEFWDAATGKAQEAISSLPTEAQPLVGRMKELFSSALEKETKEGVRDPMNALRAWTKEYFSRVPGEGRKIFEEKFPELGRSLEHRVMQIQGPHTRMRTRELLEHTTPQASYILSQNAKVDAPWFEMNPVKATTERLLQSERNIASARLAKAVIKRFAREDGPGMLNLKDFVKSSGLQNMEGVDSKLGIPAAVANEFLALQKSFDIPVEAKKWLRASDAFSGLTRSLLTNPNPAFHGRNLISDLMLSAPEGGTKLNQLIPTIKKVWKGDLRDLEALGALKGGKSAGLSQEVNPILAPLYKKFPAVERAVRRSDKLTQAVENFTRTWHFLSQKAAGMSDLEAAAAVRRNLLDYQDLTRLEKSVARRIFLFYPWPRKVIPRLFEMGIEHPNKFAMITRATTWPSVERPKEGLPEFIRQSAAIPLSPDQQGNPRFLMGFGSPLEELNKLDVSSPEGGLAGIGTVFRKLGSQLVPQLKVPAEVAFGKELYFDRPIVLGDKAPAILNLPGLKQIFNTEKVDLGGGKTKYRADPYRLYYLLKNTPFSRIVQTLGQAADVVSPNIDERKSSVENLLQILTGIRIPRIDPEDLARTEISNIRAKMQGLIREGRAGEKPIFFAKSKGGVKDAETQALLRRSRSLQKLLKSAREEQPVAPP
jgi:hypothetical protein